MFFLNLSLAEFITALAAVTGIVTALYLLDRAKKKRVVSTLRFWVDARQVDEQRRRKRVREPWSLILQLASLLLLLLALAQLQWGTREQAGIDRVLVLDTSSWMAQRTPHGTLEDEAKRLARRYINALPDRDRILILRADGLSTPATGFTPDRKQTLQAIAASQPSYSALDLREAILSARHALQWSGNGRGEIAYIGPGRLISEEATPSQLTGVRVITVASANENCGIRRIGVHRSESASDVWNAAVTLKNYSTSKRTLQLQLKFGITGFVPRAITLDPGEERIEEYQFSTSTAGSLTAWLSPGDSIESDDRVTLALPKPGALRLAVFSAQSDVLRPLIEANPSLRATYFTPDKYVPKPDADVILLDQFAPAAPPQLPSLWMAPPAQQSPFIVVGEQQDAVLNRWNTESGIGTGLRSHELHVNHAQIFAAGEGDLTVAQTNQGPTVIARPAQGDRPRSVAMGFDPLVGAARFELTTPLLFADILQWLEPESLRVTEISANPVGDVSIPLGSDESTQLMRVTDEQGFAVPFTIRNQTLSLYQGTPAVVNVVSGQRDRVLSLTLPGIADYLWTPPAGTEKGVPAPSTFGPSSVDLWKWLAVAGGLGLLVEWLLYGLRRGWRPPTSRTRSKQEKPDAELVTK